MGIDQSVGNVDLRTQIFDGAVKGFATQMYKFKQAVTISPTSGWKNFFYRETPDQLTAKGNSAIKGIPRGAQFPQSAVEFQKVSSVIEKYGYEDNIFWEDILSDDVDVRDRTLFRVAEAVTFAVDNEIWSILSESQSAVNIQSITSNGASQGYWNETSAAIIDNLLEAKQKIGEKNYGTEDLMCFVSPRQYRHIMNYLASKGAQFPSIGSEVATNGRQGRVAGVMFVESNSVSTSFALVVKPKIVGTWKEMVALQTTTTEDPYKSLKIRSVEMGATQLTDPNAAVLIRVIA